MINTKTKKVQLKLINDTWRKIDYTLSSIKWGNEGKKYLALTRQEEKNHDKIRPQGEKRGISISDASKLFAVKRIVEVLTGNLKLTVADYLNVQKSCFYAVALVENYGKELIIALDNTVLADILACDYTELMK